MNQFKKQLGFATTIVILIVVILIAVGGVGYYFYKTPQEKKGVESQEITQPEEEEFVSPPVTEKQIGYIKAIYTKNNKEYLDIDYVQYLTGDEAIEAVEEDGECPADIYPDPSYCIPNGFYIRNQNPKIRTFEILKNVEILRVFISSPQSFALLLFHVQTRNARRVEIEPN